ncbi:hypothetical protein LP420_16210 [Massilia sp. B-10]|nr:hypothetical protein LP420_16210 [Massilia sp. B-10]
MARILKEKDPVKKFKALRESTNPQAQFLWAIFHDAFHYIAVHLGSIADNARDVDFAMRWGFGWAVGPFGNLASRRLVADRHLGQGRHRCRYRAVQCTAASLGLRRPGR